MSATTLFRARNRDASGPSVTELVKYYESLSATSSLLLRGTIARDGGAAGAGQGGLVARPLQPRDDQEECARPAHGCGTPQQTPSRHRGSGDCDRRNHLHNATRGDQAPSVARFYDRRGIEYASPGTRQAYYHRRGHGLRADGDVNASTARKTPSADHRENVVRVTVFVVVHPGSDRKPRTGSAAFDVSNSGTFRHHLLVDIEWDDYNNS